MEQLCLCTGERWRLRITAHDPVSLAWLRAFDPELPAPVEVEPGIWRFEDAEHREFATDADPLLDFHLVVEGHNARAWASFDGRAATLGTCSSAISDEVVRALGDLVRVATVEETMEIAMRWMLAWEHLGCVPPSEIAFWFPSTVGTAYVVDDVAGWLRAGAPLPIPKRPQGKLGVFFGLEGADIRLSTQNDIADVVNERHQYLDAAAVGAYITDRPGARVLLAVVE